MKTKKLAQILFAAALLILGSSLFTTNAHARMAPRARHLKNQTGTYIGDFQQTVNGVDTWFSVYGDTTTDVITDITDDTDGVDCTINAPDDWKYETSPKLEIVKVEFSVTIAGTKYHLVAENTPLSE